ncbi:endonuclease NucS domain-containing protein [Clostridium botulinum]
MKEKQVKKVNDLITYYKSKNFNNIYDNYKINLKGINYSENFYFNGELINEGYLGIIGIEEWYIYWVLICNSNYTTHKYIKTNIDMISKMTKLNIKTIKKYLESLIDKNLISNLNYNDFSKITRSDTLELYINFENNGNIAIPKDYAKNIIEEITPIQWGIYTVLCCNYKFFNKKTSILNTSISIQNIIKLTNVTKPTIIKHLYDKKIGLVKNDFQIIKVNKRKSQGFLESHKTFLTDISDNNIYQITIFEQLDYLYFNFNKEAIKFVDKKSLENLYKSNDIIKYRENKENIFITFLQNSDNQLYKYRKFSLNKNIYNKQIDKNEGSFTEEKLEDYLVNNLNKIEEGLTLIKRQYQIENGVIDILARDKNNKLCIIELKIVSDDKGLIYQCAYYPTQFKEETRIITIAPKYNKNIKESLKALGGIELLIYKNLDFKENEVKKLLIDKF